MRLGLALLLAILPATRVTAMNAQPEGLLLCDSSCCGTGALPARPSYLRTMLQLRGGKSDEGLHDVLNVLPPGVRGLVDALNREDVGDELSESAPTDGHDTTRGQRTAAQRQSAPRFAAPNMCSSLPDGLRPGFLGGVRQESQLEVQLTYRHVMHHNHNFRTHTHIYI